MKAFGKPAFGLIAVCLLLAMPSLVLAQGATELAITSSAFAPGAPIPLAYTCGSAKVGSPPLSWEGVPKDAKALVLIVKDPDAPGRTFIHWVVYDIPASTTGLDANMPPADRLANGAIQGVNSLKQIGYKGPCPPPGPAHHYHFELMALDTALDLKPGATAAEVDAASRGHVKAEAELIGTFAR